MSVSGTQNASCCKLPPVQAEYSPKGDYTELAGLKTYSVGPEDAKEAVLVVYDIFGMSPQILQGADLLASQGFRVFVPDFMKGEKATPDMFSGTDEANKKKEKFFSGFPGAFNVQAPVVGEVTKELAAKYSLGAAGFCWGWKVIAVSTEVFKFKAIATGHPSFPAQDDAEKINVPVCFLPSEGEDMSVVKPLYDAIDKKTGGKSVFKHFDHDVHGFMGARADFKDEKQKQSYHEGYTIMSNFFKANL